MYGILGIYKPKGMSSFDVIRIVKKNTGFKKIGHGGTLDPMAEGVLPLLMGEASAYFDALLQSPKTYEAEITLGSFTDTDDAEGSVVQSFPLRPVALDEILAHIAPLSGEILQTPPQYSALKVGGKRAYELARAGGQADLKPRKVTVYGWDNVFIQGSIIKAEISCSSGTYIRSLARSLGEALGTGAYLSALKRTLSGGIGLKNCLPPESISAQTLCLPVEEALDFLPKLIWEGALEWLLDGKPLDKASYRLVLGSGGQDSELHALVFNNKFLGLVRIKEGRAFYQKNLSRLYEVL